MKVVWENRTMVLIWRDGCDAHTSNVTGAGTQPVRDIEGDTPIAKYVSLQSTIMTG